MAKKVSVSAQIKKKVDLDDVEGDLRMALKSSGEIKEFRRLDENRYELIASPNTGFHGIKAEFEVHQSKEDRTSINLNGKIVRTRWGKFMLHFVIVLIFAPWLLVLLVLWIKSEKATKQYADDVVNQLRFNL